MASNRVQARALEEQLAATLGCCAEEDAAATAALAWRLEGRPIAAEVLNAHTQTRTHNLHGRIYIK